MPVGRGARWLLLALLAGGAGAAEAKEPPGPWEWLETGAFEDAEAKPAPGLSPEETVAGLEAARSSVTFALVPGGAEPAAGSVGGAGFLASADGLAVGPWALLARAHEEGPWLYGRTFDGPWVRAFVLGGSWASELGVVRLATRRRDHVPLAIAPLAKDAPGKRFVAVGTALGRRHVLSAATLVAADWFDPTAPGGKVELRVAAGRTLGKGAFPFNLRFAAELTSGPGEGSPVVDLEGRCVAVVTRMRSPAATIRPVDLARSMIAGLEAEGRLDSPDLGLRFEPVPAAEGVPVRLPPDLERLRAQKRERGGVVVGLVSPKSPALATIWPGDVILEIEGRPVFGDVPESVVAALETMPLEAAVDVVLWRGGKRETVQVRALPGRRIYPDFQAEHDARGGGRAPARR